ncbi:hypothetical protein Salat_2372400 [Sesamum alatum]|uniref:Uncharacterized protein n=1 Tax=Sesamum alatum TaxID=300844 RepID=A0AAE1XX20_9LAMI|nr:hypothetical protein Salat_2372400 [Sesamum alatum]
MSKRLANQEFLNPPGSILSFYPPVISTQQFAFRGTPTITPLSLSLSYFLSLETFRRATLLRFSTLAKKREFRKGKKNRRTAPFGSPGGLFRSFHIDIYRTGRRSLRGSLVFESAALC